MSDGSGPPDADAGRRIDVAVAILSEARRTRRPAAAPPIADAAEAYAIQDGVAHAMSWSGDGPSYWKSGGPSRAADTTHARLPASGVVPSGTRLRGADFCLRFLEAELALRFGRDVDAALAATLDEDRAARLVNDVCVSIELVDSRWTAGLDAPALAKLADLQSHGALVLGEWTAWRAGQWDTQAARIVIGDAAPIHVRGSHPLGSPTWGLPAFLRHVTARQRVLRAGSVVTTGSWCGMQPVPPGTSVHVAFDGIGEASFAFDD